MSTQHPDNVNLPFFAESPELGGEDEVQEAYYAYSHLGCSEQMWDCEGKEVDNFVVRKLLTRYDTFFSEKKLGRDVFLTMRVPNPEVETAEAKILLETLESIPRSFDTACLFYGDEYPPIFEVILPMTTSHTAIDNIYRYYTEIVVGKQERRLGEGGTTIADWIGRFRPDRINVIPLFEEMDHMLDAHNVVRRYLEGKDIADQRVFLARSDPAMNYGLVSAVFLNKLALQNLREVSEETGTRIYPIIGVGSAPFRGGLSPLTVDRVIAEYPSAHTFTVQSAFKYDYPLEDVQKAVRRLEERKPGKPRLVDEEGALDLIERSTQAYERLLGPLAPLINRVARYVPKGGNESCISACLGMRGAPAGSPCREQSSSPQPSTLSASPRDPWPGCLDDADIGFIREVYVNFDEDMRAACRFLNTETGLIPSELAARAVDLVDVEPDEEHARITAAIARALRENETERLTSLILQAAHRRKFLG
jgi:phosphoenolpyruvate carboxylase